MSCAKLCDCIIFHQISAFKDKNVNNLPTAKSYKCHQSRLFPPSDCQHDGDNGTGPPQSPYPETGSGMILPCIKKGEREVVCILNIWMYLCCLQPAHVRTAWGSLKEDEGLDHSEEDSLRLTLGLFIVYRKENTTLLKDPNWLARWGRDTNTLHFIQHVPWLVTHWTLSTGTTWLVGVFTLFSIASLRNKDTLNAFHKYHVSRHMVLVKSIHSAAMMHLLLSSTIIFMLTALLNLLTACLLSSRGLAAYDFLLTLIPYYSKFLKW